MKKYLFPLIFLLIFCFSYGKTYYHFEGKLGNTDISMDINIFEKETNAFYSYNKFGELINLTGKFEKNKFILSNKDENFEGNFVNGKFEGLWKKGNNLLKFTLLEDYKESFSLEELKNINMSPIMLSTTNENYTIGTTVFYNRKNFLSVEEYSYLYSGGAHGNYGVSYKNYDKISKKLVSYSDFFDLEAYEILESLLLKEIKNRNISTFGEDFYVSENIYFTEKGIYFVYNPYEIASYADGIINIFLPYEKIPKSIILKNNITKRITK